MHRDRRSKLVVFVGVLAAVVGAIGYTMFGWRFGGEGPAIATWIGVAVAIFAVVVTIYRRWA